MKHKVRHFRLKRELGLFEATLYGVGIILGAGIYALIGIGAGIAGNTLWISFILAATIASFTGLSYAELSSMYPKESAEYVYTKKAFRSSLFSFTVSWILIVSGVLAAATVSLGFGGYFSHIFGGEPIFIALVLIILLSLLNYCGIKMSARFNIISTVIEMSGLLLVILIGLFFMGNFNVDYFAMPSTGITGIITAAALIFFAYIGFEDVVKITEETKNARRVIPKALILSLIISTVLYILVAISSISILGFEELSRSEAPLTEVVASIVPRASFLMSVIALFATSNTVLILLIAISRMFYGVSMEHSLPKAFSRIGRMRTPYISVFLIMFLAMGALLIGGLETIAMLTNLGVFISFIIINSSLIVLRYRKPGEKRPFKVPINLGRFPVLALLGILSCSAMLLYFEPVLILFELFIVLVGAILYKIFRQ